MRIPIEALGGGDVVDYPGAEPGKYLMKITAWKQDVATRNGVRDVVDFAGDNDAGQTVGAALWIKGPGNRPDGTPTKGNLWMYRRLAEALGPKALEQYRTPLADGGSAFRPTDWKDVWISVEVGQYGVDDVDQADPAVVRLLAKTPKSVASLADVPTKPQTHQPLSDDDIPF